MATMPALAAAAALLAALIHVMFFLLESVLFQRPDVWRRFGLTSAEQATVVRPMAFNQGFYNLFLALGVLAGLLLIISGNQVAGKAIVMFACAAMVGAGVVLLATNRRFLAAAAIQAAPPLVALIAMALS
jgi:putative membrane protein